MRIVKIEGHLDAALRDDPVPPIGSEDVLIEMTALGLCGSDLATFRGMNPLVSYPRTPGHEIAGKIVQIGQRVPDGTVSLGSDVTVYPYSSCGRCSACKKDRRNCCRDNQTLGVQRDGAACDYISVPYGDVIPATGLDSDTIATIEPLSIGWHAAERGHVGPADTVAVLGCGMIGLGVIIASAHRGARVIAVDIDEGKLKKATGVGAGESIDSARTDLYEAARDVCGADGPDVVFEAAGHPQTYAAAVELAGHAGRVVYIGYAKAPVTVESKLIVGKELDIVGSRNARRGDFHAVLDMLRTKGPNQGELLTHRYSVDALPQALSYWDTHVADVTKIMIDFKNHG